MTHAYSQVASVWWLLRKDAQREYRSRLSLLGTLLLGVILAVVLLMQFDAAQDPNLRMTCGSFWIAVFFAGTYALDRSIGGERQQGCWQSLATYPVHPASVYFSKVLANALVLSCLEIVLTGVFWIFSNLTEAVHPIALVSVALLGNLALSSLGTLCSALTQGLRQVGPLLTLLLFPLAVPILLATTESTRLLLLDQTGPHCTRWIHLLLGSAVVFTTAGLLVFDDVVEEYSE